jgi:hypothetical protein
MDRDSHKTFAADAAGNIGAGSGNFTVGDRERRAGRWFATAAFCHNGNVPKPVIGRLRHRGSRGEGGRGGKNRTTKYSANAVMAHESDPRIWCDDAAYPGILCSKFAAPRQHEKFPKNQMDEINFCSPLGTGI